MQIVELVNLNLVKNAHSLPSCVLSNNSLLMAMTNR